MKKSDLMTFEVDANTCLPSLIAAKGNSVVSVFLFQTIIIYRGQMNNFDPI